MKPKHVRIIDGIPCMAVMEHEEIVGQLQAEKRSGNVTFVTLAGKLAALGLVQAEAILDPDGYDGGVQWKAIEKLLRFVKGEDDEH
jgi:hypothetical protein